MWRLSRDPRPYRPMAFWQRVVHKTHPMTSRHFIHRDAHPHRRLEAIGLMALATICFACLDSTAKYLVGIKGVPVAEVTWFRFAGHVVFTALVLWPLAFKPSLRSKKPLVQIAPLGADGGDHGLQLRGAALSPARPDRHHLLPDAAARRGARRASARRVGRLAPHARHRRRLSRRAARDASGLRHGALGDAARAGGDASAMRSTTSPRAISPRSIRRR